MTLKNRKEILARLIEIPDKGKRAFWSREMMFLKKLEQRYSLEFYKLLLSPRNMIALHT